MDFVIEVFAEGSISYTIARVPRLGIVVGFFAVTVAAA